MKSTDVIVLVGGFGTRLRAVVPHLPKPLASVAGRPFLAHLLDAYAVAGMRRAILATGYRSDQVEATIGSRWNTMDVVYSHESVPLGTGGAIRHAAGLVLGSGVHVANGDTFLRYDPFALETETRKHGARIGIALAEVDDVGRYGAVEVVQGLVRGFREKGGKGVGLINAGSYFITGEGLSALPTAESYSFEEMVLAPWAAAGDVAAFTGTGDFIDIGVPDDYARAQHLLADARS